MTTTTKTHRQHKLDLDRILAGATPPEPKTLDECLAEAGGYPFTVVALSSNPNVQVARKAGDILTLVNKHPTGGHISTCCLPGWGIISCYKRYQLLGHIPGGTK